VLAIGFGQVSWIVVATKFKVTKAAVYKWMNAGTLDSLLGLAKSL
jgi:hypothetical protein